jgi:hypothetical protein
MLIRTYKSKTSKTTKTERRLIYIISMNQGQSVINSTMYRAKMLLGTHNPHLEASHR